MKLGQRLELKQSQRLVMTPQLQQALKVLQMPAMDVAAFIDEQVQSNPLLKLEEPQRAEVPGPDQGAGAAPSAERRMPEGDAGRVNDGFDTGGENLFGGDARMGPAGEPSAAPVNKGEGQAPNAGSGPASGSGSGGSQQGASMTGFEDYTAATESLRDSLLGQIAVMRIDRMTRALADYLVDELEEDGYLRTSTTDLAERLGVEPGQVENALAHLQDCDPAGVGARSLKECFALQLKRLDRFDPAMEALVDNLADLAAHRRDRLLHVCGVDDEDLDDMIAELRALDAHPGSGFGGEIAQTAVPDVFIRPNGAGGWLVELNGDVLPKVLIDQDYAAELSAAGAAETKSFLADCSRNATWLTRLLDQRAQTILKVTTEIVRRQALFFHNGVAGLKPMTLKDVAEAVKMHESTISRVAANKRLYCERGLFDLKFFFTTAITTTDGADSVSSLAVKGQIKTLIDNENPARPLSDERVVTHLKQNGVNLARRTVAKYREAMNIPSSSKRKRMKAATASR